MNILVLTDHYPPHYEGGYELVCRDVSEWLRKRGHRVTVLTSTYGVREPAMGGHVHRLLCFHSMQHTGRLARRLAQIKQFVHSQQNYRITRNLIEQLRPDFVFVWNLQGTSITPVFAAQDLDVPSVFQFGSHWLVDAKLDYVDEPTGLQRVYRAGLIGFRSFKRLKLDAAIIVSESLKRSYLDAGFDIERLVVIPNAIRDEWIAPSPPRRSMPERELRLLYVGRFEAVKGTGVALEALAYLVNERGHDVRLEMVGRGEPKYVGDLRAFVEAEALTGRVKFTDFMPLENLMRYYGQHDVLLFPTPRREGFGMVAIEAMSQGVPVIASDIGGPNDIIVDGETGYLVAPGQPAALADAVERLVVAPGRVVEMGRAAWQAVDQKYRLSVVLKRYEAFLTSYVEESRCGY